MNLKFMRFLLIYQLNDAQNQSWCHFLKKVPKNLPRWLRPRTPVEIPHTVGLQHCFGWVTPASVHYANLSSIQQLVDKLFKKSVVNFFSKFCKFQFAPKLYLVLGFSSFLDMLGTTPRRFFWAHAGCSRCILSKIRSKKLKVGFRWKKFCI
jgi:hypothetical protein